MQNQDLSRPLFGAAPLGCELVGNSYVNVLKGLAS
jgi:hypothetical protein